MDLLEVIEIIAEQRGDLRNSGEGQAFAAHRHRSPDSCLARTTFGCDPMRFVAKLTCIMAFLVTVAAAQDAPTFHAQSELVVVSAVVTDHSGAHVPNLKKEDFSVRENGAEQKIAVLEEIHS